MVLDASFSLVFMVTTYFYFHNQSKVYSILHSYLGDKAFAYSQTQPVLISYPPGSLHVQEASTAKLFAIPLHGSPNVSIDTPMLQLFDPMQACKRVLVSITQH